MSGAGAPSTHARPQPMPKLRESRGFIGLLVVSILLGAAIGLVQVGVPTIAGQWDSDWLAGPLLAAFASAASPARSGSAAATGGGRCSSAT